MSNQALELPDEGDVAPIIRYWVAAVQTLLTHDQRREVVAAIDAQGGGGYSTTALAARLTACLRENESLENDQVSESRLSQLFPALEEFATVARAPKFTRDDHKITYPISYITEWLADADPETGDVPGSMPTGASHCIGHYIGETLAQAADEGEANQASPIVPAVDADGDNSPTTGLAAPFEALVFADIYQHAEVVQPDVSIAMGSLAKLRESGDVKLLDHLHLGTTLPDPDGEYQQRDDVHDFAVAGTFEGVITFENKSQIKARLRRLMLTWVAGAQELYTNDAIAGEDLETTEAQLQESVQYLTELYINGRGVDHSLKRFGMDVRIEDVSGRVLFGVYARDEL